MQRFSVVALAVVALPAVVLGLQTAASASPAISSVVVGGTLAAPSITVTGSGFGADPSALGTAYPNPGDCGGSFTGSDYANNFTFTNATQPWQAGRGTSQPGDNCIGVLFTSYSNTQIVFTLGSNFGSFGYLMAQGDAFTMTVLGATLSGTVPTVAPASIAPTPAIITPGQRATWSFAVTNPYSGPLTGVTATFHALANGTAPLGFDSASMPGCVPSGNTEVCSVGTIPANASRAFLAFVPSTGLAVGATIAGDLTVSSNEVETSSGTLNPVTIVTCGNGCVVAAAAPGTSVSSIPGPTTDANPTKQIVTLPAVAGAPLVAVSLGSITPGANTSTADKQLCPTTGTKCSGQISVIGGDYSAYNDRAHPIRVRIIMHWTKPIPKGHMILSKLVGPPIQLPRCVRKNGLYNTPCALPENVAGSLATHNLITIDTVLFVGTDPHIGRRATTLPDAPIGLKVVAGKKSATVTWKAPIVTNGAITGYIVTPHLGKVAKGPINVKGTGTKRVVTGLVSGKAYTFTLQAKNAHGISFASLPSLPVKIK